jgi:hypothetical protein
MHGTCSLWLLCMTGNALSVTFTCFKYGVSYWRRWQLSGMQCHVVSWK